MSQVMRNNNNKKTSLSYSSTVASKKTISPTAVAAADNADCTTRKGITSLQKYTTIKEAEKATENSKVDVDAFSSFWPVSFLSMAEQQPVQLTQIESASTRAGRKVFRTMPSFKIMSYQNVIALLTVLVCGIATVNGLKCYMCGQYNEGVGSITPCLNYSEQYAHLYLKECSKKSEKYCVKYVSELSIVRDCATECAEKEIWETQTYCCTEDGCNGSIGIGASAIIIILPAFIFLANEIMNTIKQQRR